jgi:protein TonB
MHLANSVPFKCKATYSSKFKCNVYQNVEVLPEFPGGYNAVIKFISSKMRLSKITDMQASIRLQILIDNEGHLRDVKITNKKPEEYSAFEREFLRVFKILPKWKPGECAGKSVFVEMPFFMHINLQD